uniref:HMG box domain-containing protein n=1 Tax=Anopheles atroparvus TaxID=41427 RepID=A0AAG5DUM9_ANOAO
MQFNSLVRPLLSARLVLTTRQTAPDATTHCAGLHITAAVNDDGGLPKSATPEKPKRPVNTYIRFVQSIRSSLASTNPKASPTDISKLAAVKWQTLDQSTKTKLEEEYKREQAVWLQKNAKYLSQLTDAQKQEMKLERQQKQEEKAKREQKRMMKELGRPKRPMNGYLRFCAHNKPKQGLTLEENKMQMKNLGLQWKRLSDADRERYTREAEEDMKRYHGEMKEWEDKMLASDNMEAVRKKNVLLPPSPAAAAKGSPSTAAGKSKKSAPARP